MVRILGLSRVMNPNASFLFPHSDKPAQNEGEKIVPWLSNGLLCV